MVVALLGVIVVGAVACGASAPETISGAHVGQACVPGKAAPPEFRCAKQQGRYQLADVYSLRCRSIVDPLPRRGSVRFYAIEGDQTTCVEVKRLLVALSASNLQSVTRDGFHCDDLSAVVAMPGPPLGACDKSSLVGFQFNIRVKQ